MSDLAKNAEAYVNGKKSEWANLVEIALAIKPDQVDRAAAKLAKGAGVGKVTVKKKIEAIRFKAEQGWPAESIKNAGQSETISAYVKAKVSARTDTLVMFPHRVTQPVRDALEQLGQRIAKVLRLKNKNGVSWDHVFDFIVADYTTISDEELLHRGGGEECAENRRKAKR